MPGPRSGRRLAAASGPRGARGGRVQGARSGSWLRAVWARRAGGSWGPGRCERRGGRRGRGDSRAVGAQQPAASGPRPRPLARRSHRVSAPRAHGGQGRGAGRLAAMEPAPSPDAELRSLLLANASDAFPSAGANASGPPAARSASSLALAIAITALYSAVCAVGLLGNVLVMFGIVRSVRCGLVRRAMLRGGVGTTDLGP